MQKNRLRVAGCGEFGTFSIELSMRLSRRMATHLLTAVFVCSLAQATPGSFRGTVVEGEQGSPKQAFLYVQGRNGSIRRVDISQASIEYDEDVPLDQRKVPTREQLVVGAEVRVTAEEGNDGEWRASLVEIIKLAPVRNP